MEQIILKAMPRSEKPKKVRNAGFIPGVLNGPGTTSTSVQFDSAALNKIITKHGTSAKLWIEVNNEKKFGLIKEVQKHPVEAKVIHVAIQLVSQDQEVKMQLPIIFHGHEELEHQLLQLQVYKPEIEVEGKAQTMPDEVIVEVSDKAVGYTVTAADFNLAKDIKILDQEDEVYAIIKGFKQEIIEEPVAVAADPVEPAKAAE